MDSLCIYCAIAGDKRVMTSQPDGRVRCEICDHEINASEKAFKCSCKNCRELEKHEHHRESPAELK